MANPLLSAFALVMVALNRLLANIHRGVHYAIGYVLYYVFKGLKPQTHTRPHRTKDGHLYSPAVVITGASEGETARSSSFLCSTILRGNPR